MLTFAAIQFALNVSDASAPPNKKHYSHAEEIGKIYTQVAGHSSVNLYSSMTIIFMRKSSNQTPPKYVLLIM